MQCAPGRRSPGRKRLVTWALLGLSIPFAALAASSPPDLLWPLEKDTDLIASFGEYRVDHFHGGVDISTRGTIGWEVRAAAGGEIFRLKVQWRGYGRAIYVRHPGGWITVYAHLQDFDNRTLGLEDRLAGERARRGIRFPGDIYLTPPVSVIRGQRIGRTGESGAGGPHLHFELRDPDNRPVDPIRAVPGWYSDPTPPVLESVELIASSETTFIDGSWRRKRFPLRKTAGRYTTETVPFINGPVVASLRVADPGPAGHRLGIVGLRARLNGVASGYELDLDSFGFSDSPLAGLIFDLRNSRLTPPSYDYFLVRRTGNRLGTGLREIRVSGESPVSLELESYDSSGNRSRGRIAILGGKTPRIRLTGGIPHGEQWEITYRIDPGDRSRIELVQGEPMRLELQGRPLGSSEYLPLRLSEAVPASPMYVEVPPSGAAGWSFRARLRTGVFQTHWSALQTIFPDPERSPDLQPPPRAEILSWDLDHLDSFADLRVRLPAGWATEPVLRLEDSTGRPPKRFPSRWNGEEFSFLIPLADLRESSWSPVILFPGIRSEVQTRELPMVFRRVDPYRSTRIDHEGAGVTIPARALFEARTLSLLTWNRPPADQLILRGGPIRILPEGLLFRRSVLLEIPGRSPGNQRLGVYRWDGLRNHWVFQGPPPDPGGSYLTTTIRRTGIYALLEDRTAPVITGHHPAGGARLRPEEIRVLMASVEEIGKGIDWDGVRFELDGIPQVGEYDPDRLIAECQPDNPLAPGDHRLTLQAIDRAGNRSTRISVDFRVLNPVEGVK